MSPEGKRALIAALRRVVFTGLIILGAWLLLVWLRGHIPESMIRMMNEETDFSRLPLPGEVLGLPLDSSTWDWSRSLWTNEPVSKLIGQRLAPTLRLIGLTGLVSLVIASILLLIGVLVSRITERSGWLARLRSILRMVLVSAGSSIPPFIIGTFLVVFLAGKGSPLEPHDLASAIFWPVLFSSLLPALLLVQAGQGELTNIPGNTTLFRMMPRLGISLIIRLLRLVGVIIVISISAEQLMVQPGLGRPLVSSLNQRDFPLVFGIVWVFVIITALTKLAADLIEIAVQKFGRQVSSTKQVTEQPVKRKGIPKGWVVFALVLVAISILVAIAGPMLAPYGWNEIRLQYRLAPPSAVTLLGADNVGRDILSRLLYGIRIDVFTGLICAGVLCLIAAGWAYLAGYFRKLNSSAGDLFEDLVTLPAQIIGVFPWLVLFLLLMSMVELGGGTPSSLYRNWPAILVVTGLVLLPRTVSMIQEAYRSPPAGKSLFQSILLAVPLMSIFTVAGGILYVSTASYLGFGFPPPIPDLGGVLSGAGMQHMIRAPWMALWPAICLILLLVIWVMAGEALLEMLGFRTKAVWSKIME